MTVTSPTVNLARNKTGTASCTNSGKTPASAFDGSTTTNWASCQIFTGSTTKWLAVDLGASYAVGRAKVMWSQTNYATNYQIQYLSGSTWTTCATVTGGGPGWKELTFPAVNARQFRVLATANAGSYYTIYEFELYAQ